MGHQVNLQSGQESDSDGGAGAAGGSSATAGPLAKAKQRRGTCSALLLTELFPLRKGPVETLHSKQKTRRPQNGRSATAPFSGLAFAEENLTLLKIQQLWPQLYPRHPVLLLLLLESPQASFAVSAAVSQHYLL